MTARSAIATAVALVVPLAISLASASSPAPLALSAETAPIDRAEADKLVRQLRGAVKAAATRTRPAGAPARLALTHEPDPVVATPAPAADDVQQSGAGAREPDDGAKIAAKRQPRPRRVNKTVTKATPTPAKGVDLSRALLHDAARLSQQAGKQAGQRQGKASRQRTETRTGKQTRGAGKAARLHAVPGESSGKGQGKRRGPIGAGSRGQGEGTGPGSVGGGPRGGPGMGGTGGTGSGTPRRR